MSATFIAKTSATANSPAITLTIPATAQAGDLALLYAASTHTPYSSDPLYYQAPTGWTALVKNRGDGNTNGVIWYRTLQAGDPGASVTVNNTQGAASGYAYVVQMVVYRGVTSVASGGTSYGDNTSTGFTLTTGALSGGGTLVGFWTESAQSAPNVSDDNLVLATGWTERDLAGTQGANAWFIRSATGDRPCSAGTSYTATTTGADTGAHWVASGAVLVSNTAPNAPSWVTPQNSVIPADQDAYIEIAFSDPDSGDSMSASNWKRWALDANGNRVGTAVTTYQPTPSTKLLIPAGTLTSGTQYEFQADTLDSQGAEGPYSASLFVTAQNTPAQPTWTDPISGQTIGTSSYTGVISAPSLQESEWTLYADNAGAIGSAILQGPVSVTTGDLRSHTFTGLANNVPVWWSVRIKDNGLWSQPTQIRTPVSYTPPDAPVVTLTPDAANGALIVDITNPAGTTATSYNNVYIDDGKGAGKERVATMLPTNTPWTYALPVSLRDYTGNLWVEAVASNGTTSEVVA